MDRLSIDGDGLVVYVLKRSFSNGTSHVLVEPLDFIGRLAALVPRPRVHFGLFAPNAEHRHHIVRRTSGAIPSENNLVCSADVQPPSPSTPLSWMQRLRRVFHSDISQCPLWGTRSSYPRYHRTETDSPYPRAHRHAVVAEQHNEAGIGRVADRVTR